jgi:putative redox protein
MKARVKWIEGAAFLGESGSGHAIVLDGAPEYGGRNLGIRPMEALLIGLGACSAFDVVTILNKGRQPFAACEVALEAERRDAAPKVFTKIHLHFVVTGVGLDADKVARAVRLSVEKYCSASAMLGATAEITHEVEIAATKQA